VTIWDSTGTVVQAQATVPAGTGTAIDSNGFRYVSLSTPMLLAPGNYTIGAFYPTANDSATFNASTISTAPGVTYMGSREIGGNAFPPGNDAGLGMGYFGPNFQFTAPPTNGVPDAGATWTLLLLGLTSTIGVKFFVRRSA
jgi:hypothetical protein